MRHPQSADFQPAVSQSVGRRQLAESHGVEAQSAKYTNGPILAKTALKWSNNDLDCMHFSYTLNDWGSGANWSYWSQLEVVIR